MNTKQAKRLRKQAGYKNKQILTVEEKTTDLDTGKGVIQYNAAVAQAPSGEFVEAKKKYKNLKKNYVSAPHAKEILRNKNVEIKKLQVEIALQEKDEATNSARRLARKDARMEAKRVQDNARIAKYNKRLEGILAMEKREAELHRNAVLKVKEKNMALREVAEQIRKEKAVDIASEVISQNKPRYVDQKFADGQAQ